MPAVSRPRFPRPRFPRPRFPRPRFQLLMPGRRLRPWGSCETVNRDRDPQVRDPWRVGQVAARKAERRIENQRVDRSSEVPGVFRDILEQFLHRPVLGAEDISAIGCFAAQSANCLPAAHLNHRRQRIEGITDAEAVDVRLKDVVIHARRRPSPHSRDKRIRDFFSASNETGVPIDLIELMERHRRKHSADLGADWKKWNEPDQNRAGKSHMSESLRYESHFIQELMAARRLTLPP